MVISSHSITHLLHLAGRSNDPLAVQNRGNLRFAQGVAFDGQGTANGANAIDAPQLQRPGLVGEHGQFTDGLADFSNQVQNCRGDGVGGLIVVHAGTIQSVFSFVSGASSPVTMGLPSFQVTAY